MLALLTLHPMIAVILAGAVTLMICSGLVIFAMIGEVNRRLPEDQQVSYLWGYPGKLSGIRDQYRRFYPTGTLSRLLTVLQAVTIFVMAIFVFLIGRATHNF